MTVTFRKYNPGFLSDDELITSFCVRTHDFDSLMEVILECSGNSNIHQLVIGPRGSGKTSLLLRVAVEIRRDPDLSSRFFPVVFAEESYEVASVGEFWLECLSHLADQAPNGSDRPNLHRTVEELRQIQDDRMLADRCLGALQDFSDSEGKRLVPIVENLNMMFRDIADKQAGWRLRHTLQTEPRVLLIASATSRFQEIDDPKRALYDLFRVLRLNPLTAEQCSVLWNSVSGRTRPRKTMRALRILTGGSPRLVTILARFGDNLSFRELMADLLDLVDDHTEYFKSHLDALPQQERRVYLALADLWKPATTREIARRARLDTSKCSAQLARLTERGAVEVIGGTPRRKLYYLTERLYNIYYLMRRSRGRVPLIEALIRFMEAYYSPEELREFGTRIVIEAKGLDEESQSDYQAAFTRLIDLRSMAEHREELRSHAPWMVSDLPSDYRVDQPWPAAAQAKFDQAVMHMNKGQLQRTLAVWDEVISRFDEGGEEPSPSAVARALLGKALTLGDMGRPKDSLVTCDNVLFRFGTTDAPGILPQVAGALVCKGMALTDLSRKQEALAAFDEIVHRFGHSNTLEICSHLATALLNKGVLLGESDRTEEALAAWNDLLDRFYQHEATANLESVAIALSNSGNTLARLNRPKEALVAWDKLVERFAASNSRNIQKLVAFCLLRKGNTLSKLSRPDEAIAVWDEVVRRFAASAFDRLRYAAEWALLSTAELELARGHAQAAIHVVDRVFDLNLVGMPMNSWRGHLIRAQAYLTEDRGDACVQDVEHVLMFLPLYDELPKEALDGLCALAVGLGFDQMCDLIKASPSSNLLLPLTTALEKELGLETRVAKEVEEVAEDIRLELRPMIGQSLADAVPQS